MKTQGRYVYPPSEEMVKLIRFLSDEISETLKRIDPTNDVAMIEALLQFKADVRDVVYQT